MRRTAPMRRLLVLVPLALCAAGPDAPPGGQMVASAPDGSSRTCAVTDFNFSFSRPEPGSGAKENTVVAGVVTNRCVAGDAGMLAWVAGRDGTRTVQVTFTGTDPGAPSVRYDLEGVAVSNYTIGLGPYTIQDPSMVQESIQFTVAHVRINGALLY